MLKVQPAPGEPTVAGWIFDVDVEDPTEAVAGLSVNGQPGLSWVRDDTSAFRVDHGVEISVGMTWSNTAGAGGIVGTDGQQLAAGSGTVEAAPP